MRRLVTILTIIIILIFPKSIYGSSREYFIDKLNIEAEILNNGDVTVNEIIEYRFQGDFNGVYRNLELNGTEQYLINEISIIDGSGNVIEAKEGYNEENNTYEINENLDTTEIKIFTKSSDESKRIKLNYTIKGAAKRYADYSELYWNFYSVENIPYIKEGTLKIRLKDANFDTSTLENNIYGDGDITENNTDDSINISFRNLTTLIGVDLKFQNDYLSMAEELDGDNYYEEYIDESLEQYLYKDDNSKGYLLILGGLLLGGVIGVFSIRENKFNKEVKEYRENYVFIKEEFVMEPPSDLPPALVNLLINEKLVAKDMLNITLLYLASKGYYDIEEKISESKEYNKDLVFTRTDYNEESGYTHLDYVLNWFKEYELNGSFSMQEIKKVVSSTKKAKKFINNLNNWMIKTKRDGENIGFYTKIRNRDVIQNNWYNERNKWLAYKNYLKSIYSNGSIDNNLVNEMTIIYAHALEIDEKHLKWIINLATDKIKGNNDYFNDKSFVYMNNYFLYSTLFNDISKDAHRIGDSNNSSTHIDSTTFFSGSDFSGGGGGGSGAF